MSETGKQGQQPREPFLYRFAIGQDSHRFVSATETTSTAKPATENATGKVTGKATGSDRVLMLGGVEIPGAPALEGNSDADVILHALTNAISGITCVNILGAPADKICLEKGITDSRVYLQAALAELGDRQLVHVSISVEAQRPRLSAHIPRIRASIADLLSLEPSDIGLTATSGEGLTSCGRGEGIAVFCAVTAYGP